MAVMSDSPVKGGAQAPGLLVNGAKNIPNVDLSFHHLNTKTIPWRSHYYPHLIEEKLS